MTPDTFPAALVEALATVITDAVAECDNGPGLYPHEARQNGASVHPTTKETDK